MPRSRLLLRVSSGYLLVRVFSQRRLVLIFESWWSFFDSKWVYFLSSMGWEVFFPFWYPAGCQTIGGRLNDDAASEANPCVAPPLTAQVSDASISSIEKANTVTFANVESPE